MNLYWVDDKVYMEIPRDVLGKRLLMGGVVDKLSNPQESSVGFALLHLFTSEILPVRFFG